VSVLNDFTGGLNDTVSLDSLKPNELIKADNVLVFKSGGIETRSGVSVLNEESYDAEIDQDIMWLLSDGTYRHLVMSESFLHSVDDSDGTLTSKIELQSDVIGYVVYEDKLFFVDGDNYYVYGYFKYTSASGTQTIAINDIVKNIASSGGGTAGHFYKAKAGHGSTALGTEDYSNATKWEDVTDGSIPDDIRAVPADGKGTVSGNDLSKVKKCTILEFHPLSYRVFAAGNPDDPTAVYFSEINNQYAFKGSSVLYPTSAAGPIKCLQSFMSYMLVGYKREWMYWDGVKVGTDAEWRRVPIPSGCVNHWAKVLTPYSLTFWGNDGLYIVYPGILIPDVTVVATKELYTRIDENKVEVAFKSMCNPDDVRLTYHDGNVYFAYGTVLGGRNNSVLVLNWDLKTFVMFTGWQVNDWHLSDEGSLWFASKNYILKYDSATFNDIDVDSGEEKAIAVKAWTPPLKLGNITDSFIMKHLKNVYVAAKQYEGDDASTLGVTITSDYTEASVTTPVLKSFVWGLEYGLFWGFVDLVVLRVEYGRMGFRHALRLESAAIDNHWFIYSLGFDFEKLDGTEAMVVRAAPTDWITD